MRINELTKNDREIRNYRKLDLIMLDLCRMVVAGKRRDSERYGTVAAAILDPENRLVKGINTLVGHDERKHAERVAIENYEKRYGKIPTGSILLTTCSPCSEHMADRHGDACTELINNSNIKKVYCGFIDPTQPEHDRTFNQMETANTSLRDLCRTFAETFMDYERAQAKT